MKKTFEEICVELDATLLYARARILHKQGFAISTIAARLHLTPQQVKDYINGSYCLTRPGLPKRLCQERTSFWGVPVYRISCSESRIRRSSKFHRDSYI